MFEDGLQHVQARMEKLRESPTRLFSVRTEARQDSEVLILSIQRFERIADDYGSERRRLC
jgi:hypothetical protein